MDDLITQLREMTRRWDTDHQENMAGQWRDAARDAAREAAAEAAPAAAAAAAHPPHPPPMAGPVGPGHPVHPPAHVGGYHKIAIFTSGDGVDWATWRTVFEVAAAANEWNDLRQRQEIAASMSGVAHRAITDILHAPPHVDGEPPFTAERLLNAYELRFLPPEESSMARVMFQAAVQTEAEGTLQWHARVRSLFTRAFPAREGETSIELIDRFILGLVNERVREYAYDQRPATYTLALTAAHGKTASIQVLATAVHGVTRASVVIKKEPGLNAIVATASGQTDKTCWHCNKVGHLRIDCRALARTSTRGGPTAGAGARGRAPAFRGRPRPPFTRRPMKSGAPAIQAIEEESTSYVPAQDNIMQPDREN